MVNGVLMVPGQHVLIHVEEEHRRGAEPAVILLRVTEAQTVREMLRKRKTATHTPAPVRFWLIILNYF